MGANAPRQPPTENTADRGPPGPDEVVAAGDEVTLAVRDGTATAELVVANSPGTVLSTSAGVVAVERAGEVVAADADGEVLLLAPGTYTVVIAADAPAADRGDDGEGGRGGVDGEVDLAVGEVRQESLPSGRLMAGELTRAEPVLDVDFTPVVNRAWQLVGIPVDGLNAVVHDTTELASGEAVEAGEVVCDQVRTECLLATGRTYVLRVRADALPSDYGLALEELWDRTGPDAVLLDGEAPPIVGSLDDDGSVTYELTVGHPGDVVVQANPAGDLDVVLDVGGDVTVGADDRGGPGEPERVRVTAEDVTEAFGRFEVEVSASGPGGTFFVIVERD